LIIRYSYQGGALGTKVIGLNLSLDNGASTSLGTKVIGLNLSLDNGASTLLV